MSVKKLTCVERDEKLLDPSTGRPHKSWEVASSLTDPDGIYGAPIITTTWERGEVQIKDIRHPKPGRYTNPDERACEHYELTGVDRR